MRPSHDIETFGAWLKRRRKLLDLTQDDLGRLAGCSGAAIRKFEADERKPSRELAESLARALGIPDPEREPFLQLARGIRPASLPAVIPAASSPRVVPAPPENLPAPLTSLVDRVQAVADVSALLTDPAIRWVSLIGPPGIGKTRLSIQTGRQVLAHFADGVWFVDLAPLEHASHVLPALSRALAPLGLPQSPTIDQLSGALRNRSMLLVLDNFEHVTDAAVEIAGLLKRCAGLKVLATSRIPLFIYGEHEYRVPALSIPPASAAKRPESLLEYESVQLFVARARQHQRDFSITPESAPIVADVCITLEGMPLALELAAASLQRMTLAEMDAVLHHIEGESWIRMFGTPARDLPTRQRTLENVVAWSYTLLTEPQRDLFCKLGIFSGWFDLDAVLAICFEEPYPTRSEIRCLLDALSDHSLLVRDNLNNIPCWRMLEVIHEYAVIKLETGIRDNLLLLYEQYFIENLEIVVKNKTIQEKDTFFKIHAGNLHSTLKWMIAEQKTAAGFQMAERMDDLWSNRGYYKEGLELTKQLFALPDASLPEVRANRMQTASDMAWQSHDFETALSFAQQAAELGRIHNLRDQYPWYLNRLGRIYIEQGNYDQARQVLMECLSLASSDSSDLNIGCPLAQLGEIALFENNLVEAKSLFTDALVHLTESDDIFLAISTVDMAEIALAEKDYEQARIWLGRAFQYSGTLMRRTLVFLCAAAGYLSLSSASRQQELATAARLYGAIENLAERSGVILGTFYQNLNRQRIQFARQRMPGDTWRRECETGRQWDRETALKEVKAIL